MKLMSHALERSSGAGSSEELPRPLSHHRPIMKRRDKVPAKWIAYGYVSAYRRFSTCVRRICFGVVEVEPLRRACVKRAVSAGLTGIGARGAGV